MTEWMKKQWAKMAAGCALLVTMVLIFAAGRYKRDGQLDLAAAKRELEMNLARGEKLEAQLTDVRGKQTRIVADILADQLALAAQKKKNQELSNEEVIARLRADGLVAPE